MTTTASKRSARRATEMMISNNTASHERRCRHRSTRHTHPGEHGLHRLVGIVRRAADSGYWTAPPVPHRRAAVDPEPDPTCRRSGDHIATTAAVRSRRSRKYNTKTAGVNLIATASPTSIPRGQRGFSTRQPTAISAMRMRLTCPKTMVASTGSSSIANVAATALLRVLVDQVHRNDRYTAAPGRASRQD